MRSKRGQSEEPEDVVVSFDADTAVGPPTKGRRHKASDVDSIVDALLGGELAGAERPRKRSRKRKTQPKPTTPSAKTIAPALPDISSSSEVEDSIVDLYAWEASDSDADNQPAKPEHAPAQPPQPAEPEDAQERQMERQRAMRLAVAAAAGSEGGGGSDMPRNEDEWFAQLSHGTARSGKGDDADWESGSDGGDLPTDIVKADSSAEGPARRTGGAVLSREKREAVGKYLAVDCEMVGAGFKGSRSILARVSIVNFHGHVILDTFVAPMEPVTDYRTWVSGIRKKDLDTGRPFKEVQQQVADLLKDKVLVGHAVRNDLNALMLTHPPLLTRDTTRYAWPAHYGVKGVALRKLAASVLQISIQQGEHSSVTDAKTTMLLYRKVKDDWERSLAPKRYKQQVVRAKNKERFARLRQEIAQQQAQ
ncbi:3'-5' exonuclease [Coemansia spiralis]|nr:3'-5' exonuclease [Coemansia spiralis]